MYHLKLHKACKVKVKFSTLPGNYKNPSSEQGPWGWSSGQGFGAKKNTTFITNRAKCIISYYTKYAKLTWNVQPCREISNTLHLSTAHEAGHLVRVLERTKFTIVIINRAKCIISNFTNHAKLTWNVHPCWEANHSSEQGLWGKHETWKSALLGNFYQSQKGVRERANEPRATVKCNEHVTFELVLKYV